MTPESTEDTGSAAPPPRAHVFVLRDSFGFVVVPPVLAVSAGDEVRVRNLSDVRVVLRFPGGIVDGGAELPLQKAKSPGDRDRIITRSDGDGVHEYVVAIALADDSSLFARGGSNPRIVFD